MIKDSYSKKELKKQTRNKKAVMILIISGLFVIEGNMVGGSGIFGFFGHIILEQGYITDAYMIDLITAIIFVFGLIGSLGGITVLLGAGFIFFYRKILGKLLVALGTGMGLIGLFIIFLTTFIAGIYAVLGLILIIIHSIGWIGVLLSIYGTKIVK